MTQSVVAAFTNETRVDPLRLPKSAGVQEAAFAAPRGLVSMLRVDNGAWGGSWAGLSRRVCAAGRSVAPVAGPDGGGAGMCLAGAGAPVPAYGWGEASAGVDSRPAMVTQTAAAPAMRLGSAKR
ncbi:hypothetical protein Scel_01940 [Streptomyces cellostaticus]|nr:hypothetical protein Scel_01940 [Streptomyces cellostaticus]